MHNYESKNRIAVALGDFDGMHRAHKTVVTGGENAIIYCVNNRFSLLQKSIFGACQSLRIAENEICRRNPFYRYSTRITILNIQNVYIFRVHTLNDIYMMY